MRPALGTAVEIGQITKVATGAFAVVGAVGALLAAAGVTIGVAFAVCGVVGALTTFALGVFHVRAERSEVRAAMWLSRPQPVRQAVAGDAIYDLGVETEAREALEAVGLGDWVHAPYARRDVDADFRRRLSAAVAVEGVSLLVLEGPAKSGKSRTALEALRALAGPTGPLGDAVLVRPADATALVRLASRPPPREAKANGACVVWLDDIEVFVKPRAQGLNTENLGIWFKQWQRPVLVVGTAGGKGRHEAAAIPHVDPLADLLRANPPVALAPWFSETEQAALAASDDYADGAAERIAREGIGEFMIVASRIRDLLTSSDCDEGLAVARAAIDWRRIGLLRPIPSSMLRRLYQLYLPGPAIPGRFEVGIKWATGRIYSHVALVEGSDPYEPYDYAVRYDTERQRPIPGSIWDRIIEQTSDLDDLHAIGLAAFRAGKVDTATDAWRRGEASGHAACGSSLGYLLDHNGDEEGAAAVCRRADERGDGNGSYNLAVILHRRGDLDEAEVTYRRAEDRGHPYAPYNLGHLLKERGKFSEARAAWRRAEQSPNLYIHSLASLELKAHQPDVPDSDG